jgi:hypothetical protein
VLCTQNKARDVLKQWSEGFSLRFEGYLTTHVAETVRLIYKLSWQKESCHRTGTGCNTPQSSNTTVLEEQSTAHDGQNAAPQTGTAMALRVSAFLPGNLYPTSSEFL